MMLAAQLPDRRPCPACGSLPLERCWDNAADRPYTERGKTAYHPERLTAPKEAKAA